MPPMFSSDQKYYQNPAKKFVHTEGSPFQYQQRGRAPQYNTQPFIATPTAQDQADFEEMNLAHYFERMDAATISG